MAHIVFYEKPGCATNTRQKALLRAAGHTVEVHSLIDERWTPERLRLYFAGLPVHEWFNPNAPAVKSGAVDPASFDEAAALAAMCATPLLIRRPLLRVGEWHAAGFDGEITGLLLGDPALPDGETCSHRNQAPCPVATEK